MKTRSQRQATPPRVRLLELALLALPFIALTPNFFIIPDLSYQGNATQEVVVAWTTAIFLGLFLLAVFTFHSQLVLDRQLAFILIPLACFLIWTVVSLLWTPEWAEGVRLTALWLAFGVFFSAALLQLRLKSAIWLFHCLTAIVLILAVSQFIEYWQFRGEMLGVFFSHGVTTELIALILPLQLVVFLTTKKKPLVVLTFLTAAAGAAALFLTLRRGAMLGASLAVLFIGLAWLRKWLIPADKYRLIVVAVSILILFAGVLTFKREEFFSRLRGALQLQAAPNVRVAELGLTSRLVKWITALDVVRRNPVLGVGNGGFPAVYGEYRRYFVENPRYAELAVVAETEDYDEIRSPHAHNEFLQVFAELGLVGLALYTLFWAGVVRLLWRARKSIDSEWVIGVLAGIIAFATSSAISGLSLRYSPGCVTLACVAGLGCAIARRSIQTQNPSGETSPILFTVPKWALAAILVVLTFSSIALALRNRDVLNSQRAQSQIDFRFSLESPALNEGLLRRYQQVLSMDPANSGARLGMGFLLFQMKRPAETIPEVEYALKHSYGRPYAYVLLAFAYEQMGRLDKADEILSTCLVSFPKSLVARSVRAEILSKLGRTEEAQLERNRVLVQDTVLAKSWHLALSLKDGPATAEATRLTLIAPKDLEPTLVRLLAQARAYHYMK